MMAEVIAASLIQRLIRVLAQNVISQTQTYGDSFRRISSEMTDIKRQLELMRVYLKRAHMYSDVSETLDAWVTFLRDVAFEVEDLVDEYTFIMGEIVQHGGMKSFIDQTVPVFKTHKTLHGIATRLGEIRNNLTKLPKYQKAYEICIPNAEKSSSFIGAQDFSRHLAESAHLLEEDKIVLWDGDKKRLAGWLKDETQKGLSVIAVQGMGGLGKTTLVTRAYNSPEVIGRFVLRAWVPVTQRCLVNDLLRRIITELHKENEKAVPLPLDLNQMNYVDLVRETNNILSQKKYLIVLDDIWEASVWRQIRKAFVDNGCGSRVVITTRNEDVAFVAAGDKVLPLKVLSNDDARRLFIKYAFPQGNFPQDLESLASEIVDKCQGLPLALVSMGNYVATQMAQMNASSSSPPKATEPSSSSSHPQTAEPSLSKHILDSLTSSLQQYNQERDGPDDEFKVVRAILELSINNLPHYLRSCFLYCSIFPRGQQIKRKTLIRLWVSEGLVEKAEGMTSWTVEGIAESYLEQLVRRCLFQVASRNLNGRLKRLKVHNFVHDVIVIRSRKEIMHRVSDGSSSGWSMPQVRHLSLVLGIEDSQPIRSITSLPQFRWFHIFSSSPPTWKTTRLPQLRSFHVFSSSPFEFFVFCFKFLRMLNLENAPLTSLPDDVVSLFNLRFLSIRRTEVKKLPKGIGNLRNLETLDAIRSKITSIPKGVTKLENLRHLMASTDRVPSSGYRGIRTAVRVPKGVCNLENLQTLKYVNADELAHNLKDMKQIRTLHVAVSTESACEKLSESIQCLDNLRNLRIQGLSRRTVLNRVVTNLSTIRTSCRDTSTETSAHGELHLGKLTALPPKLQKLLLRGKLENGSHLPTWLNSHTDLRHLDLRFTQLEHDSIIQLGSHLPQLVELQLRRAYDGGKLFIPSHIRDPSNRDRSKECFLNLKSISFVEMRLLETIIIAPNALKSLENMILSACENLKSIPEGISKLTKLKKLILDDMPEELVLEIRYRGNSVRNISCIEHCYEKNGIWNKENLFPEADAAAGQINEQSQIQVSQQSLEEINEHAPRQTVTGQQIAEGSGQSQEQNTEVAGQEIAESRGPSQEQDTTPGQENEEVREPSQEQVTTLGEEIEEVRDQSQEQVTTPGQ